MIGGGSLVGFQIPNVLVTLFLWAVAQPTVAQTSWNPTGGPPYLWSNSSNWTAGVPIATSTVTIGGALTCTLDVNPTIKSLTFSGSLDMNGHSLLINGNNVTNTFTGGAITNSGVSNTITTANTGSGGATISATSFGTGANINFNTTGTTTTTISGAAVFNGTVTVQSRNILVNGAMFNEVTSFTKTGGTADTWTGGNTFTKDATIINQGTGALQFPSTNPDNFKNLTLKKNGSGALTPSYTSDCKIDGNLVVNGSTAGVFSFGNGTVTSGTMEFIGAAGQSITKGGGVTQLSFSKIYLNKSTTQAIFSNTAMTATISATFANGILVMPSRIFTFGAGVTPSGASVMSFIDGTALCPPGLATFTFPVGHSIYALPPATVNTYRPITLTPVPNVFAGVSYIYADVQQPSDVINSPLTNISRCEAWFISGYASAAGQQTKITLSWSNTDCFDSGYITNTGNLLVARFDFSSTPQQWVSIGNTAIGTFGAYTLPLGGTITSAPYTMSTTDEIFYVTLGSTNQTQNPLPVELSNFSGWLTTEGVRLHWQTASELNNDDFEIERSSNGIDFTKIGEVDGHGTTSIEHKYSFLDSDPLSGLSYYRLRQVDFDGQATYSDIISISNFESELNELSVYPNPTGNTLFLSHKATDVKIVDVLGRVVFIGHDVDEVNVGELNPGFYYLVIPSSQAVHFIKK